MEPNDDPSGTGESLAGYSNAMLLCGFCDGFQVGKNAAGDSFPEDEDSRLESERNTYGGKTFWGFAQGVITSGLCTYHELLWELSWVNVEMMIRDAVRTDYKKEKEGGSTTMSEDEVMKMLG